ncbi:uncharacterized [Tachysurus ichikawai]
MLSAASTVGCEETQSGAEGLRLGHKVNSVMLELTLTTQSKAFRFYTNRSESALSTDLLTGRFGTDLLSN